MEKQYRTFNIQCRTENDEENENKESYKVEGYASTFEEEYPMGEGENFRVFEKVSKDAFNNCQMDDVIFQYDHEGRVFARTSNNTLSVVPDEHGLKVIADLGGTEEGRKLYNDIKGGYITRMSFAFTVRGLKEEKRKAESDGATEYIETITDIARLFDVSAVSIPANDATEINARKYCENIEKRSKDEDEQAKIDAEKERKAKERERLAVELSLTI